jgi:hypothetical protein
MKVFLAALCVFYLLPGDKVFDAPSWTPAELAAANTAANVVYLDPIEKETLKYINLARLYPQKFMQIEVLPYNGPNEYPDYVKDSPYKASLIADLKVRKPIHAMRASPEITKETDCFAKELGESGRVGHERKTCNELTAGGECCSFGMATGKDVALQLLIDHDVPSLGHRLGCLDAYKLAGLSYYTHKTWSHCLVLQMR